MKGRSFALALAFLASSSAASPVRDLPYPFDHVVTLVSDVDMQAPWHGAAIHRVINEEIGLPISDSLWVHASNQGSSALFLGATALNRQPSGVGTQPTFALLLRQWHRGNIDHFHGWTDDASYTWRWELDPPVAIGQEATLVSVRSPQAGGALRQNVRLYFDAEPPPDLSLELTFEKGPPIKVPPREVIRGRSVQMDRSARPAITEVLLRTPGIPDPADPDPTQPVREIAGVRLKAPSCREGCAQLVRIETGHFSRRTVAAQIPWLEAWNVRPALLTSHGGMTYDPAYGAPDSVVLLDRESLGLPLDSPIVTDLRPMADIESGHAYHSDLLHRLGIDTVFRIDSRDQRQSVRELPQSEPAIPPFYALDRNRMPLWGDEDQEAFVKAAVAIEPLLDAAEVAEFHCGADCGSSQGATVGLLLATSLAQIDAGIPAHHLWYTHLGSSQAVTGRTEQDPLRPVNVKWLRELARRHYGFEGAPRRGARPWVVPTTTLARYRIVRPQVEDHLEVVGSRVSITRWTDPLTGRTIPDHVAGSRDLHGITVDVDDPGQAELWIGRQRSWAFTRNVGPGSEERSITIVDDSTPTALLDEIRWSDAGGVDAGKGDFVEPREDESEAASGQRFASLVADASGRASVTFRPDRLELWNTTHLQLALRRPEGKTPRGMVRMELRMADGGMIAATDEPTRVSGDTASRWRLPEVEPDAAGWERHTLATTELEWPPSAGEAGADRPALPLGKVETVTIRWEGVAPGARLDVDAVRALRPATTGESPDATKLLAGRVSREDAPVAGVEVWSVDATGTTTITTTDEDGYYFFYGRAPGVPVAITARGSGTPCPPLQGRWIDVLKNEAELDIELTACAVEAPQGRR